MHRADRLDVEREARTPCRLDPFGRPVAAVAGNLELGDRGSLRGGEWYLEQPAWSRRVAVRAWRRMVGQRGSLQQGRARDRPIGLAQQHLADVARRHVGRDRRRNRRLAGGRRAAIGRWQWIGGGGPGGGGLGGARGAGRRGGGGPG